jgi:hypothetical protein
MIAPADVRKASAFLQGQGVKNIPPKHFAAVSQELGKGFADTLRYLALLLSGGSGEGPSPIATAGENRLDPIRALGHPSPTEEMEYDDSHP